MSSAVYPVLPGLTFDCTKTPEFQNLYQESVTGKDNVVGLRVYPIYAFQLIYEALRSDANGELQSLLGFFLQRAGRFDSFLFTDPDDNSVSQQVIGVGDGTTTSFQLLRTYGGFTEPLYYPNVINQLRINGVVQTLGTNYTISGGTVTFAVAPAVGYSIDWSGSYYFKCRFLADTQEFSKFYNMLWEAKKVLFRGCLGNKIT